MDERVLFWSLAWAQSVSGADLAGVEERGWIPRPPDVLWAEIARGASRASRVGRAAAALASQPVPPIPDDVVLRCDPLFPDSLRHVHAPPFALWVRGDRSLLERRPAVAMVGARHARRDSVDIARTLAAGCASVGLPVVSGLALGIDAASHRGALDGGGPTIAVLPASVEEPYPSTNRALADRILADGGLLVSEHSAFESAQRRFFPARNRIIAALADVLVVIQAAARSGTSTTIRYAEGLGIDVGVVPSFIGDVAYGGSIDLLRDGARSIIDLRSILMVLGLSEQLDSNDTYGGIGATEHLTVAELADRRAVAPEVLATELLELELSGVIRRQSDGRYARA